MPIFSSGRRRLRCSPRLTARSWMPAHSSQLSRSSPATSEIEAHCCYPSDQLTRVVT